MAERLDLPQPAKGRILAEIAADLEGLHHHYLEQGLSEEDARSKAAEMADLADETLMQLVEVHQSGITRWLDGLSMQARAGWERGLFIIMVAMLLFSGVPIIAGEDFFSDSNPFIWPVAVFGLCALMLVIWKSYLLYIRKDHRIGRIHRGLSSLIFLGMLSTALAVFGFTVELYIALKKLIFHQEGLWLYLIEWLQRGTPLLLFSLSITLSTALIWFLLTSKVQKIVAAELPFLDEKAWPPK